MRISEVADATGVPVHTIKYYLREELLRPGRLTSRTRAEYGPEHVIRVRLIRALLHGAGLSLDSVRRVVAALDDPPASPFEVLELARRSVPAVACDQRVSTEIVELLSGLGWQDVVTSPAVGVLCAAVQSAREAGLQVSPELLAAYAAPMEQIARVDVGRATQVSSLERAVLLVTAGTVMIDPVLAALRRLAQLHVADELADDLSRG